MYVQKSLEIDISEFVESCSRRQVESRLHAPERTADAMGLGDDSHVATTLVLPCMAAAWRVLG